MEHPAASSEQRLALLIDEVQEYAIFLLEPDGTVATWNRGAQRIKGYSPEEVLGRHFSIFYPADDIAAGKPERELELAAADGVCRDVGWRVRRDGTAFWANVVITALRDENGRLQGFAKVTRDETDRREQEERAKALAWVRDRERIAAELHQTIVHSITRAALTLEGSLAFVGDPKATERVQEAIGLLDGVVTEIRRVVLDLETPEA